MKYLTSSAVSGPLWLGSLALVALVPPGEVRVAAVRNVTLPVSRPGVPWSRSSEAPTASITASTAVISRSSKSSATTSKSSTTTTSAATVTPARRGLEFCNNY